MEEKMQYEDAPKHNLETWARLRFMITWGTVISALILLAMAATLTP